MKLRRILIVLVVVAIAIALSWRQGAMQEKPDAAPREEKANDANVQQGTTHVSTPIAKGDTASVATRATARLTLEVHTPTEVRAGEVFEARIDIDVPHGVRELLFALAWDKKQLALVAATAGSFATQGAAFAADEPSDGNVQISVKANQAPLAGRGTLVNLRFEALKAGTTNMTLRNVNVVDATGTPRAIEGSNDPSVELRGSAITVR